MKSIINEIKADNTSGATQLTLKAAEALKQSIESDTFQAMTQLLDHILKTSREVYSAKPAMASLASLGAYAMAAAETCDSVKEGAAGAINGIERFIIRMKENVSLTAAHAASLIETGSSIMTISYSSFFAEAATRARSNGRDFTVYCLESRPLAEGVTLARLLAGQGINTVLLTDASLFLFMEDMSMVMVGGDSLSPEGLINKTGTSGLAMAAEKHGVPFYALCSSEKLLPTGMPYQPRLDRYDPRQILPSPYENIQVINCYFDSTPLERLTGVITERGLIQGDTIMEHFSSLPARRHLLEILQP